MIEILGYLFLRPYWLALVPVAVLLGMFLTRRAERVQGWEQAVDASLLKAMRRMGRIIPGQKGRDWWPALVLAVLGIALSGPATERQDRASYRNLDAVVLVIDLSPSVLNSDRLFDVITTSQLIASSAGTRQVAAVVYSGEAYTAAPFSSDVDALMGTLALLDANTMPVAGTRPSEALSLARRMISDAKILAADVVLVSDGGGIGQNAMTEADLLLRAGAPVSVIEVPGATDGAAALSALARIGGGVGGTLADPFPVARSISDSPVERLVLTGYPMLVLNDFGRYLLLLALIPAFMMLPRRRRA